MQTDEHKSSLLEPSGPGDKPPAPNGAPQLSAARKAWVENISILFRHKYLILSVTVIVTVLTGWYAFTFMPNYYKARAVILPARHSGGGLDDVTSGISSTLKDIGIAKLKGGEDSYSPLSLMMSRELQEKIIRQFNFQKEYECKTMDDAVKTFSENLDGELSEEGNFIVSFEDTSPRRAAQVANAVVEEINNVNSQLAKDEAAHNIAYVQKRYQQNAADLDSAEHAFLAFQQKYGIFSLTEQARAEMTALGGMEEQEVEAEIQKHNAEQMYGSNSSDVAVSQGTIDELESKLAQMKVGMDAHASSFVPTNVLPEVAMQYLSLTREFEIQSKLKAFLLPSYEQAKLDESKNTYGFVTLDHAEQPFKKAGPHRSIILLGSLFGSFFIMSFFAIIGTNLHYARINFRRDRKRLGV
jgi:tyrosine-protein kinase Etk/Wzc